MCTVEHILCACNCVCVFLCLVLRIKLKASHMLNKNSINKATPQYLFIYQLQSSQPSSLFGPDPTEAVVPGPGPGGGCPYVEHHWEEGLLHLGEGGEWSAPLSPIPWPLSRGYHLLLTSCLNQKSWISCGFQAMARDWKERCPRVKCDCDKCENGWSYLLVFFTWARLSRCSPGCLWSHDILPWPPKCWDQRQDIHTYLILILPNSLPVGVCFFIHLLKLNHYNFKSSSLPHFFFSSSCYSPPLSHLWLLPSSLLVQSHCVDQSGLELLISVTSF